MVKGIRGAVRADANTKEEIYSSTSRLLQELLRRNSLTEDAIISMFITATPDLTADFPAYAVRGNGLVNVPVLCASEIAVPGAMTRVIRILLHVAVDVARDKIRHVYLGDAAQLRPDLADESEASGYDRNT